MSCPTCDHTMQTLIVPYYWCPRCGTVVNAVQRAGTETPWLVERCRKFGATLGPRWLELWHQLGIAESINVPERRPT